MMINNVKLVALGLSAILLLYGCGPGVDVPLKVVLHEDLNKQSPQVDKKHGGLHDVVTGDTIYGLSRKYDLPVRLLIIANKIDAPYRLKVGDKLVIPPRPIYVVKSGDTIYNIARKFDISTRDVVTFNDLKAPYVIRVGDKLNLPITTLEDNKNSSGEVVLNAKSWKRPNTKKKATTKKISSGARVLVKVEDLSGSGFVWPVRGTIVRKFGFQEKGIFNAGLNVQVPRGTPVIASENGVVVYSSNGIESLGNLVLLKHSQGYVSAYGHLDSIKVSRGDRLQKGDVIGLAGTSGNVDKPQLHFQVRHKKKAIDPVSVLKT